MTHARAYIQPADTVRAKTEKPGAQKKLATLELLSRRIEEARQNGKYHCEATIYRDGRAKEIIKELEELGYKVTRCLRNPVIRLGCIEEIVSEEVNIKISWEGEKDHEH